MAEPTIGINISWIARMLRTRFDARARTIGLTRAQWRMIATVSMGEGATQSEVASRLEINSVTAGRIIDRLEAADLVERRASPHDRRANRIFLTSAAMPILAELSGLGEEEERAAIKGFTLEERELLDRLLRRVVANLVEAPPICADENECVEEYEPVAALG